VDARRRLISQQVADVQGFIESSKFESGTGADAETVERRTADAQTVFLVLLAIAREATAAPRPPDALQTATIRVDDDVAAISMESRPASETTERRPRSMVIARWPPRTVPCARPTRVETTRHTQARGRSTASSPSP